MSPKSSKKLATSRGQSNIPRLSTAERTLLVGRSSTDEEAMAVDQSVHLDRPRVSPTVNKAPERQKSESNDLIGTKLIPAFHWRSLAPSSASALVFLSTGQRLDTEQHLGGMWRGPGITAPLADDRLLKEATPGGPLDSSKVEILGSLSFKSLVE